MSLLIPWQEDYQKASRKIIHWIQWIPKKVDWCIYGSFVTWKVRPWLSDIDVFLLSLSRDILFPWNISRAFSQTKDNIEELGIPLQLTYSTTWALGNKFASPDYFYLQEVKRGIEEWHSSRDFSNEFVQNRPWSIDDLLMARYFLKKVSNLPGNFHRVSKVLWETEKDITAENQKDLQKFWDSFKKMFSFCTLWVRILKWVSVFDQPDNEIFKKFNEEVWGIPNIDRFLEILSKIRSIEDWYKYLKEENGVEEIMDIYDTVFQNIAERLSERFSGLYEET